MLLRELCFFDWSQRSTRRHKGTIFDQIIVINSASPITNISILGLSCDIGSRKEQKMFYKCRQTEKRLISTSSSVFKIQTDIHRQTLLILSEFLYKDFFFTKILFLFVQDHHETIFTIVPVGQEVGYEVF